MAQQGLIGWVKKNVDILMDVLNSVWVIVQANLSVLTSICGTLLSLFLGGGQAVITFIINSVRSHAHLIRKANRLRHRYLFLCLSLSPDHLSHCVVLLAE